MRISKANISKLPIPEQVALILSAAPEALVSAWGSYRGKMGGRPRTEAPRCACGAMTAKRAQARSHYCKVG